MNIMAVLVLVAALAGCSSIPMGGYVVPSGQDLVNWAKGTSGPQQAPSVSPAQASGSVQSPGIIPQQYEIRRVEMINGWPSTYWGAGSWSGTPPPHGFSGYGSFGFGGYSNPGYYMPYPRFGW